MTFAVFFAPVAVQLLVVERSREMATYLFNNPCSYPFMATLTALTAGVEDGPARKWIKVGPVT